MEAPGKMKFTDLVNARMLRYCVRKTTPLRSPPSHSSHSSHFAVPRVEGQNQAEAGVWSDDARLPANRTRLRK
jgi:hypothetical protein